MYIFTTYAVGASADYHVIYLNVVIVVCLGAIVFVVLTVLIYLCCSNLTAASEHHVVYNFAFAEYLSTL